MFFLRLNNFFEGLNSARFLARKFKSLPKQGNSLPDPREVKRLRDELHLARERVRLQQIVHRRPFL